jgi:uncharacterized protein (DUF433 family)
MTTALRSRPAPKSKSWISKTDGVCGGDACIRETRVTVWGLVEYRRLGMTDSQLLESIDGLNREDLAEAWRYAKAHPSEIETAIRENTDGE